MKKLLLVIALLLAFFAAGTAFAETVSYDFAAPKIVKSGNYHEVSLDNLPLSIEPAMPALPFKPVAILLPQGFTADNVTVKTSGLTEVKGEYFLRPVAHNIPLSFEKQLVEKRKADALANGGRTPVFEYKYSGVYPAQAMSCMSVQNARGYKVLVLNINPVVYQAETRKVYYYRNAVLSYDLKPAKKSSLTAVARDIETDREHVRSIVDNPGAISGYKAVRIAKQAAVDYLIVTTRELAASAEEYNLDKFSKFLAGKGLKTETALIEDILASNEGRDGAEKLRNYLRKRYNESGLKYVLLAGPSTDSKAAIPVRRLHAAFKWEKDNFDQLLPGDVYYCNLDGSFDENKDGIYGDPKDGIDGGDIDMFSELAAGRVPAETPAMLANFIKKNIAAYGYFEGEAGNAFFCGENLFPGIWGKDYMKEIENGASVHGFTTAGYPAAYPKGYLFDKDKRWSSTDVINAINAGGIYILNHIGHSSVTSNMRLYSSSLSRLTNSRYYLLYTQGCYCGRFTDRGCILSAHVTSPAGAYAVIGNSSYGLGPEDPDPDATVSCRGASQYFHRHFTNALFALGKNRLGDANQASKEANVKFMGHGTTRWVFFELNLLGDPYLPLKVK